MFPIAPHFLSHMLLPTILLFSPTYYIGAPQRVGFGLQNRNFYLENACKVLFLFCSGVMGPIKMAHGAKKEKKKKG
jgi:hypothetical protein